MDGKRVALGVTAVCLLASGVYAADAVRTYLETPERVERLRREAQVQVRDLDLDGVLGARVARSGEMRDSVDLASLDRALLYQFEHDCPVCARNVSNWVEIGIRARSAGIRVLALTDDDPEAAARYWGPLASFAEPVVVDSETLRDRLELGIVPGTHLVRDGHIRKSYLGLVSDRYEADLLAGLPADRKVSSGEDGRGPSGAGVDRPGGGAR